MLTPIPLSGPLVEDQNPSTPIRGVSLNGDFKENSIGYGGLSAGRLQGGQNQFRSPLHWPPPTSPIHSYAAFGGSRTPSRSFENIIPGDGRLSMSQFEFGADGELVLYSAGGHAIPASGKKTADNAPSHVRETLESTSLQFGLTETEVSALEQKIHTLSKKMTGSSSAQMLNIPSDHVDNLTPVNEHDNTLPKADKMARCAKQKTLTDGGRCRSKSMKADGVNVFKSSGTVPREDMASAPPEKRFQKIQSLYAELQRIQEVSYQLQASIRHRDGQIASHLKDNSSLWSMAAHVGTSIQLALDEEAKATRAHAPLDTKTPIRQKRRRSSIDAQENPSKCLKTPKMAEMNNQQILELEELFNSPATGDIFASCDIFMTPMGFGPMSLHHGMCPIPASQQKSTFSSLISPIPLGNFNGQSVSLAVDDQLGPKTHGVERNSEKENSFSFQNV